MGSTMAMQRMITITAETIFLVFLLFMLNIFFSFGPWVRFSYSHKDMC